MCVSVCVCVCVYVKAAVNLNEKVLVLTKIPCKLLSLSKHQSFPEIPDPDPGSDGVGLKPQKRGQMGWG